MKNIFNSTEEINLYDIELQPDNVSHNIEKFECTAQKPWFKPTWTSLVYVGWQDINEYPDEYWNIRDNRDIKAMWSHFSPTIYIFTENPQKKKVFFFFIFNKYLRTYITGHYNPSVKIMA